jgi:hypothetical protein
MTENLPRSKDKGIGRPMQVSADEEGGARLTGAARAAKVEGHAPRFRRLAGIRRRRPIATLTPVTHPARRGRAGQ